MQQKAHFLFVGKNINIQRTLTYFLDNHSFPNTYLTICTPRIKSKVSGDAEFRTKSINDSLNNLIKNNHSRYKFKTFTIDSFIWENCLDITFTSSVPKVYTEEYFVDQDIYQKKWHEDKMSEQNQGNSLSFFRKLFTTKFEQDYENPITVILGYGGIGKSTLCDELVALINSLPNKRAVYIKSADLIGKIDNKYSEIKSITDLVRLYDSVTANTYSTLHEPNNLEINISCGNVIVVIDGLDEIESHLKGRFSIVHFIESLIALHEQFNNCKVVITSRDYHEDKYKSKANIDLFYLKGFDFTSAELYFKKRFTDNDSVDRARTYTKRLNIQSDERYMPFCLRLICDIVQREKMGQSFEKISHYDTCYLMPDKVLDDLIYRLLDREIKKQDLGMSVDQLFDLLAEIAVEHHGIIRVRDFNEYLEVYGPVKSPSPNEEKFQSFYINPLIVSDGEHVRIRYDVLNTLIKARYIQKAYRDRYFSNSLISILSENAYGGGSLLKELVDSTIGSKDTVEATKC